MRKFKFMISSFLIGFSTLLGIGATKAADMDNIEIIATDSDADTEAYTDENTESDNSGYEELYDFYINNSGYIDVDYFVETDSSDYISTLEYDPDTVSLRREAGIPSSYDSRDFGMVTEAKNQGAYGTCWAFAVMSAAESSLISQNIMDKPDLSELHFAYFMYHCTDDPLGNIGNDSNTIMSSNSNFLNIGGADIYNLFALAAWRGAANESEYPYEDASVNMSIDSSEAYNDVVHLQNVDIMSMTNKEAVKRHIMEHGSVTSSIYLMNNYNYNSIKHSYYQNSTTKANHEISIIGWDDDYSADNFNSTVKPSADGAWLIKNSWGGMEYIWVSYEDLVLSNAKAYAFIFEAADNYDFNYQYDGSSSTKYLSVNSGTTFANVYTVSGARTEELEAVSFASGSSNVKYEIQIYKNSDYDNPCSGEVLLEEPLSGSFKYAGYHTVKLDAPVRLKKGERFTVAVTLTSLDTSKTNVEMYCDGNYSTGELSFISDTEPGHSYYYKNNQWIDLYYKSENMLCARIKAFTGAAPASTEITGIDIIENKNDISLSASYESDFSDLKFKWQIYDLQKKSWSVLQNWSAKDNVSWKPDKGDYWIYLEIDDSTGKNINYCLGYTSTKNYKATGNITINGCCTALLKDGLAVGVSYNSDDTNMKFRWQEYNLTTKKWTVVSDWSKSNWTLWNPSKGSYWIYVEAMNSSGKVESYAQGFVSEYDYKKPYVTLNGFCFMSQSDCIPVGAGYETNRGEVMFRWQEYDLNSKTWRVVSNWSNGNWINWKPKKGSYWLLCEAKTADGATSSFCWGYVTDKSY